MKEKTYILLGLLVIVAVAWLIADCAVNLMETDNTELSWILGIGSLIVAAGAVIAGLRSATR